MRFRISCILTACLLLSAQSRVAADLIFNMNSTGNASADAGFLQAANYWKSVFSDNITVNLAVGFSNLGGGILGSASSATGTVSFDNWKAAMATDSTSANDATMLAGLPSGSSFSVYINETTEATGTGKEIPYVDNDGGANNTTVRLTTANAKALGLLSGLDPGTDASISFNSTFGFDFDPTDGIGPGLIDFVGVAIHEIGHAMGFISGVDVLDQNANGAFSDDVFTYVTGLDFTRFSAASEAAGASIDWTADARAKYFSIDGGATAAASGTNHWSTGVANGDGRQASHWKDGLGLGIMDPTSAPAGSLNVVTPLDIMALDVIGWTLNSGTAVPEPSSLAFLAALGVGGFGVQYRCRRSAKSRTTV